MLSVNRSSNYHKLRCSFNLSKGVFLKQKPNQLNLNQINLSRSNLNIQQIRHLSLLDVPLTVNSFIANSFLVNWIQKGLINIHETTGLPWYAEIILTALFLRMSLIPVQISERKQAYKFENVFLPEYKKEVEKVLELSKRKLQLREFRREKEAKLFFNLKKKKIKNELYVKHNSHPFRRIITILGQFPVWVFMSFSIGNLFSGRLTYLIKNESIKENIFKVEPTAKTEGFFWFQDLTISDPYFILSTIFALSIYTNLEYNTLIRKHNYTENRGRMKILNYLIKGASLGVVAISAFTPSGLTLYWTSNSIFHLIQNVCVFNNPKIKKFLRIPDTAATKNNPGLKELIDHLRSRLNLKKRHVK